MHKTAPLILPKALLFDMDGTLTVPRHDFPRIKVEMGIGDAPILESLAMLEGFRRKEAEAVLHRHEEEAAANSTLNAGCEALFELIARKKLPTALITRNTRKSISMFLARHEMRFDVLISREDVPHKPHPQPLLHACRQLGVEPPEAWMIGDGMYDVQAGLAAGIRTVWISHGHAKDFPESPWQTVADLVELTALLNDCLR